MIDLQSQRRRTEVLLRPQTAGGSLALPRPSLRMEPRRKGLTVMRKAIFLTMLVLIPPGGVTADDSWRARSEAALLKSNWVDVAAEALEGKAADAGAMVPDWLLGYAGLVMGDGRMALDGFGRLDQPRMAATLDAWASGLARRAPNQAVGHLLRGDALARMGNTDEAERALDEAVRLAPRDPLARNVRGVVRFLAGRHHEAADDFEAAAALDPKLADAQVNLGIIRLTQGHAAGAVEHFTRAIELCPSCAWAYNGRGAAYARMEAWEDADADFRQAAQVAPGWAAVRANLQFLAWTSKEGRVRTELEAKASDRGGTMVAQSYSRHEVDVGGGRTMDVFVINATPLTKTPDGMVAVVRAISENLRDDHSLPSTWMPRLHVDVHGWRSSPIAQKDFASALAQQAGRDAVLALDVTEWYSGRNAGEAIKNTVAWHWSVSGAAEQTARAVAAINQVTGVKPTLTGNSGGAEIVPRLGDMLARRALPESVGRHVAFQDIVLTAYPFSRVPGRDVAVPPALLDRVDGRIAVFVTTPGLWSNRLQENDKVFNVRVTDSRGAGIPHGDFNSVTLRDGSISPVISVGGAILKGWERAPVQRLGDQLGRSVSPTYTVASTLPVAEVHRVAISMERGLRPGEKIVIGSTDPERAKALMRPFVAGGWSAEVIQSADETAVGNVARAKGATRILIVRAVSQLDPVSQSVIDDAQRMPAAPLPSVKALARNVDLFNKTTNLAYRLAGTDLPPAMKVPLAFTGALIQDMRSAGTGRFSVWTSRVLERAGEFGVKELPRITGELVKAGRLPASRSIPVPMVAGLPDFVAAAASQAGRGSLAPSIDEVTRWLDGVNKTSWAVVGAVVGGAAGAAGGPAGVAAGASRGGAIGAAGAGLVAEVGRGLIEVHFQPEIHAVTHAPVRQQVLRDWRAHLDTAVAHGVPARSLSEMYSYQYLTQIGFDMRTITEHNRHARMLNTYDVTRSATMWQVRDAVPVAPVRRIDTPPPPQNQPVAQGPWPPPPPSGAAAVDASVTRHRLPVAATKSLGTPGGVLMTADVVQGEDVSLGAMLGTRAGESGTPPVPRALVVPFLIFAGMLL